MVSYVYVKVTDEVLNKLLKIFEDRRKTKCKLGINKFSFSEGRNDLFIEIVKPVHEKDDIIQSKSSTYIFLGV